jgi:UDP-GlcNAc:undecaprenyl-phosphate GlcNAc-1-phosphate transferase
MRRAIIFMGDAGSLVCGFIISIMAIQFIELQPTASSPALAVGILFIPMLDTIRVSFIRIMNGKSPFSPDKNHLHHKLIDMGLSQLQTVTLLSVINLLVIAMVVIFGEVGNFKLLANLFLFGLSFSLAFEIKFKIKQRS